MSANTLLATQGWTPNAPESQGAVAGHAALVELGAVDDDVDGGAAGAKRQRLGVAAVVRELGEQRIGEEDPGRARRVFVAVALRARPLHVASAIGSHAAKPNLVGYALQAVLA